DLIFWTFSELYEWSDEAAKRLARNTGGFVDRDATTTLSDSVPVYAMPARHVSTIHVSAGSTALKESTVDELEALDNDWPSTAADNPKRFLQDGDELRVYPQPNGATAGNLGHVFHRFPVTITSDASIAKVPVALRDYFTFYALAEARGKESKGAMPEVAQYARGMVELLEQVAREFWGGAQ